MIRRVSRLLDVTTEQLEKLKVYDRFLEIDSALHVDPHLLSTSLVPEMQEAAVAVTQYWNDTIVVLRNTSGEDNVFDRTVLDRFTFAEIPEVGLGYARGSTAGAAVGAGLAAALKTTAKQIVDRGITDPKVFELVGVLEKRIGPDRISDMTVSIILPQLLKFTQRVAQELKISLSDYKVRGQIYHLPNNPKLQSFLILLPCDILRDLPVAFAWEDIDIVCEYNEELRRRVNVQIGNTWKEATRSNVKEKLLESLLKYPDAMRDLINCYRNKPAVPYDFTEDHMGETLWHEIASEFSAQFPLDLQAFNPVKDANIHRIVLEICDHFRRLIEDNGLFRMFYGESGKLRHERFAQLLFFAVADAYCSANNLDLSPEANSGRGPVDFKCSSGYRERVLVEVKWSSNRGLCRGFEKQLKAYENAEKASNSVYLIIQVGGASNQLEQLLLAHGVSARNGVRVPGLLPPTHAI